MFICSVFSNWIQNIDGKKIYEWYNFPVWHNLIRLNVSSGETTLDAMDSSEFFPILET